jgi:hypothetical protein
MPEARIERAIKLKVSIWEFYRNVAQAKLDKAEQHKTLASLQQQFAEFANFRPEMPSGVM